MITSEKGIDLIQHYESLHDGDLSMIGLQPKLCPGGYVTYGWGHVAVYKGEMLKSIEYANKVLPDMATITLEEANALLLSDLVKEEAKVNKNIIIKLQQCQFDALVSYFYNIGFSQTMVQLVNAKADNKEITDWFVSHYITASGVFKKGLLYRRQSEATLYTTGELIFYN